MNSRRSSHLLLCLLTFAVALGADLMPTLSFLTVHRSRILASFQQNGVQNYDTFLLSKDGATLYAGARDTIIALDLRSAKSIRQKGVRLPLFLPQIHWSPTTVKKDECAHKGRKKETECFNFIRVLVQLNETHLYTCGTYAFSPTCTYIDLQTFTLATGTEGTPLLLNGKGVSPYNPQHHSTAILVDGELYTGTTNNFLGNEPVITRTLGSRTALKTDIWMHGDAAFVASIHVPTPPDDDKVYFFFRETGDEFDFYEKVTVSRVARVCKNDVGGERVLQRKWTTFLKAYISCTQPGQFPYTVIQHIFAVPHQGDGAIFYGVFTPQWSVASIWSTAICAFSLDDIKRVFDGNYKEINMDLQRWVVYNGPAMDPRPGSCSATPPSDSTLTFMKSHYLMDEKIKPINNHALLVKHNEIYRQITVHQTRNALGVPYNVLFLGTDKGALHKAAVVDNKAHMIEKIELFEEPEAVLSLVLAPEKGIVYVGYSKGILQVPIANCGKHKTCADCILARDPYCAWDGRNCRFILDSTDKKNNMKQDIDTAKPDNGCLRSSGKGGASPKLMFLVVGVAMVFFSYPTKLKVKSKVQGCRALPKANKASSNKASSSQETVLPSGRQRAPQGSPCRETAGSFRFCCVEVGEPFQDLRAESICPDPGLAYRDDSRGAVAVEGI
ncbi:semaphorin-4A-like [Rhineura floridana]|uniref:semaphorin-4A-like n=1 Tax=Rhineura floridana TaxID=261503 RepID=UPI002AC80095|nr:semaphorin-4A-like [Rhineura floridana]